MNHVNKLIAEAKKFLAQAMKSGGPPSKPGGLEVSRPMKYPYTFTAKIMQFPWAHYAKNNIIFKYYFMGIIGSLPAFNSLSNLSNSEASKQKWAEVLRKEEEELAHHHH